MERLSEKKIVETLQNIDVSPFRINWRETKPLYSFGGVMKRYVPDYFVDLAWDKKKFTFLAEVKRLSTPKVIDQAIWQLSEYFKYYNSNESEENYYPLVVAPYLGERAIAELTQREISGIDLSGNALLIVPGELFVSRTGNPNKFPSSAAIKNVYRGTSSIVARVFFNRPEFISVNKVLSEIETLGGKTTLSTVSKVLKSLEDDLLISRRETIRLIDARLLLEKLRENYRTPVAQGRMIARVDNLDQALGRITNICEESGLLCAVDEPRRYTVFPSAGTLTRVYLESIEKAMGKVEREETERFANLELIETREPAVYFDRRFDMASGVAYTSPLQTYLDLSTGGKREQDAARQIEKNLLKTEGEVFAA